MRALPRRIARAAAAAIAAMGVVDPQSTASRPTPLPVDIAVIASRLDRVPAGAGAESRIETARRSARTVARALGERAVAHEVTPLDPLPCATDRPCVVITDGADALEIPSDLRRSVSVVRVDAPLSPNVAIVAARTEGPAHLGAEAVVHATLAGAGVAGRQTIVRVIDSGAVVGSAEHSWSADGEASVAVRWWPLAASSRVLRVTAEALDLEVTAIDNSAELSVTAAEAAMPVLVFDARPSWASVFVRRALEADPRLEVGFRARLSPGLGVGTAGARLDAGTLLDARAVVIGGPESISAAEAELLDRYVRVRGGSLILLPDRPIEGPIARLVPAKWTEHLHREPVAVGPIRATELLSLDAPGPHDRILASTSAPERPVIVSFPAGWGRIVVSGAMDAWRYRVEGTPGLSADALPRADSSPAPGAPGPSFDRFWQSLTVSAAAAGGPPLEVAVDPSLTGRNGLVDVTVRRRGFARPATAVAATAVCGARPAQAIRLWPTGDPNRLLGRFRPGVEGVCRVDAVDGERRASVSHLVVSAQAAPARRGSLEALNRIVRESGGMSVAAGREEPLIASLLALPPAAAEAVQRYPMRSPWWIAPFALCLGVEWWDRRRQGLR